MQSASEKPRHENVVSILQMTSGFDWTVLAQLPRSAVRKSDESELFNTRIDTAVSPNNTRKITIAMTIYTTLNVTPKHALDRAMSETTAVSNKKPPRMKAILLVDINPL